MKRTPWVPLDANFQDDRRLIDVSAEAELVYLRSLGLTKRLEADAGTCWLTAGHLRKLCDKLDLDATGRAEIAGELVSVGAWIHDLEAGTWTVAAWASWNVSLSEASERKRAGARQGNHRRHGHKGDLDDCPICNKDTTPDVSPGGSLVAKRPDTGRFASRSTSLDVDVDVDVDETPPYPPSDSEGDPLDPDGGVVVRIADSLIGQLGYPDAVARPDERRYVARALRRGWTVEQLTDLAVEAMSRDDVDSPRDWLRGVLKNRANTDPGVAATPAPVASVATRPPTPPLDEPEPIYWPPPEVVKPGIRRARAALTNTRTPHPDHDTEQP